MDRKRDVLVGAVVTFGIIVGVVGTIWLKGGWGQDGRTLMASATGVGQLMEGAPVKFRGVNVGRVESVRVSGDGEAVLLEMTIQPDLAVPDNAAVLIAPESMFGDWQAEIVSRTDFPRYSFLDLGSADVLPGAALPDLSRLTAAADEIAQNVNTISERVQIAFTEETAMNLRLAIGNIERVSNGLSEILTQQASRFDELAEGVGESASELGAAARAARTSFERIDRVLAEAQIDSMVIDARVSAQNLRSASGTLGTALVELQSAAEKADSTFQRVDRIAAQVEGGEGSFGRLINDPEFALRAEEALTELRTLLADIQENPSRYVRLSIF
ncbi:MAG: MlaD family protein [Longimicrobiales bacterium]